MKKEEDKDKIEACREILNFQFRERRLAEAAPAFLEALKECITSEGAACFGQMKRHPEWMQRRLYEISDIARAAIAKAEME